MNGKADRHVHEIPAKNSTQQNSSRSLGFIQMRSLDFQLFLRLFTEARNSMPSRHVSDYTASMARSPQRPRPLFQLFYTTPLVALALCVGCDGDDLPTPHDPMNNSVPGKTVLSRERQSQAMNTSIAEGNPNAWAPRSCAGACGGPAPDRSCWCDSTCTRYGDCCSDYVRECLAGDGSGQPEKKAEVKILQVYVSGDDCGDDPKTGSPNFEVSISDFDDDDDNRFLVKLLNNTFALSQPEGAQKKQCRFAALVKWTPGHRVRIHQAYIEGAVDLGGTLQGQSSFEVVANAGNGPGEPQTSDFSAPFDAPFGSGWLGGFDTYSNCSGLGYVVFDMTGELSTQGGPVNSLIHTFDASLTIAKDGQAPEC